MKTNFNFAQELAPAPGDGAGRREQPRPEQRGAPRGPVETTREADDAAGECRLSELRPAECGRVVSVDESAPVGRRLLDLGFLPDTAVRVLRRAPLGDPVVYELRGYRVCLRRVDAAFVRVHRGGTP